MRIGIGVIHRGVGDLVKGRYTLPQNPILDAVRGMGAFLPAAFSLPQNPIGLSGLSGCSSDCNCGPCRGGMGAIDFSLMGDGISTAISPSLTFPNWAVYAGGAALIYFFMAPEGGRRRR